MSLVDKPQDRRLAPFPGPWRPEQELDSPGLLNHLMNERSYGVIIHGGPGSGKHTLMDHIQSQLTEDPRGFALGPIEMKLYRDRQQPDLLIRDLAIQILGRAKLQVPEIKTFTVKDELTPPEIERALEDAVHKLHEAGIQRSVLLLSNFDDLQSWAAVTLANYLRRLFDGNQATFTFVMTAESDLEELRATASNYSPLLNISESYQLLDLTRAQVLEYARSFARTHELGEFDPDDLNWLWNYTRGYPSLLNAYLKTYQSEHQLRADVTLEQVHKRCLSNYDRIEPLRTAIGKIDQLADVPLKQVNPARVLHRLATLDITPDVTERGPQLLLSLGMLRWIGRTLTWRNRYVEHFWEQERSGKNLIAGWENRPVAFRESQLSGQGSVVVSLFLDIKPLLADADQIGFDRRRGSDEWIECLNALPSHLNEGPFHVWEQQATLNDVGHDMNLFRQETVDSFMPTYEATNEAINESDIVDINSLLKQQLDRFSQGSTQLPDNSLDIVRKEWNEWDRVRLQFTRDGAVHITLIKDVPRPMPLMRIMDELLGLERELDLPDNDWLDLSVQWEIALMLVWAFLRQTRDADLAFDLPTLNLSWQELPPTPQSEALYPQRERYVIYMMHKLCNCRREEREGRPEQRRLITIDDMEPLRKPLTATNRQRLDAYNYGRELTSLLEGVMLRNSRNGESESGRFPELKEAEVIDFLNRDQSSWQNELFVVSLDNALFSFQTMNKLPEATSGASSYDADAVCQVCGDFEEKIIKDLYFSQRSSIAYDDYWQCLTLGLQHMVELRWTARWLADRTSRDLVKLANLMEESANQRNSDDVLRMNQSLALTTRLLAHLRDAAIPMFISSADYAARKYEDFIKVSGLRGTVEVAEKNITAINEFINHHQQQMMQIRAQQTQEAIDKRNRLLGAYSFFIGLIALMLTIPSFWTDFSDEKSSIAYFLRNFEGLRPWFERIEFLDFYLLLSCSIVGSFFLFLAFVYTQTIARNNK